MGWMAESKRVQDVRDRVPLGAKLAVRHGVRRYGAATRSLRPLPDYLIIGTKRGGTTSLCRYLQQHPGVGALFPWFQTMKGVYFFDENFHRGVPWYQSHFPSLPVRRLAAARAGGRYVVGESSPYYLFHPLAAERAGRTVPATKIVVLLRDPVARAWSHWKVSRRRGTEPLPFADALAAEPERLAGEEDRIRADPTYRSVAHRHLSYVEQGRYVRSLARWREWFPVEQLLVVPSEELFERPQQAVDRVTAFLGLPPVPLVGARQWGKHSDDPDAPSWLPDLAASFADDNRRLEALLGTRLRWSSGARSADRVTDAAAR